MTIKTLGRIGTGLALGAYGLAFINPGLGLIIALSGAVVYLMAILRGDK